MVTFGFLLIFIILGNFILWIDIYLYHYSYFGAIRNLYYSQVSEDRVILFMTLVIGFIWAIVTDVRIKQRKAKRKDNGYNR